MKRTRVIPVLLLKNHQLVKTTCFRDEVYVGDPINALKIFNEKEVDELAIVDIDAAKNPAPDFDYIEKLVSECFMPLAYGGGVKTIEHARKLFALGVEKVILGASAFLQPELVKAIAEEYGAQSVVVSVDVKKDWLNRNRVFISNGKRNTGKDPLEYALHMESIGAGEILLQDIDREGTATGFNLPLIESVAKGLEVPVIALGGAGKVEDFSLAVKAGASAVAAGRLFVFKGPHKAILISYPSTAELTRTF